MERKRRGAWRRVVEVALELVLKAAERAFGFPIPAHQFDDNTLVAVHREA